MSLLPSSSPFAHLPTEIVLYILSLAAYSSSDCARALTLVASWTTQLGRTALYFTVSLRSATQRTAFITALSGHKKAKSPSTTLRDRALLIQNFWAGEMSIKDAWLFDTTTNVHNLAVPAHCLRPLFLSRYLLGPTDADPEIKPHLPPCTQLTVTTDTLRYDWQPYTERPAGRALLARLTHLSVLSLRESTYVPLAHLPALTHLALPLRAGDAALDRHLAGAPAGLRVVVLLLDAQAHANLPALVREAQSRDGRLFVLPLEDAAHARALWEEGARGGLGLWGRAMQLREESTQAAQYDKSRKALSLKSIRRMKTEARAIIRHIRDSVNS